MHSPGATQRALLVCCALLGAAGTVGAHQGGLGNQVMWEACAALKIDDPCSFQSIDQDVFRGSCQAMSNALVCVRNQPIERAAGSSHGHAHDPEPEPGPAPMAGHWWLWPAGLAALLTVGLALWGRRRQTAA